MGTPLRGFAHPMLAARRTRHREEGRRRSSGHSVGNMQRMGWAGNAAPSHAPHVIRVSASMIHVVKQPGGRFVAAANASPPLFFAISGPGLARIAVPAPRGHAFPSPRKEGLERREAPGSLRSLPDRP
ncbi:MAG: hypothetical protein K2Y27_07700, partial [Xanthobacteraceae bacterium]|nr:hypothetical protein [Xanthobacteraceae bacterium]